jgi:hypothetical protein
LQITSYRRRENCREDAKLISSRVIAPVGQFLIVVGSIVTSIACIYNNLFLDHILAMKIWRISNILLFCWAFGFWRKWWVDGLAARALVAMYSVFIVTNELGLIVSGDESLW